GEAAYATISPALLSDYFPESERGRVFAAFYVAIPVGAAAGFLLGGALEQVFGWRGAFYAVGLPGVALAALALTVPDPARAADPARPTDPRAALRTLAANRDYVGTVLGYAAYTFALGALAFWMPAFLERERGVPRAEATVQFGVIAVVTGFAGTFAGGWLADRWRAKRREADLWVCGWATLAAAPVSLVAFLADSPSAYLPAIVVAQLLLFASTGPVNAAAMNVVSPMDRATASGLLILAIHLFGDVPSPPLVGAISDASTLERAFLILPVAIGVGGAIWLYGAWRGERLRTGD
ncbi:MAG TPA: MFS transporter, partial [Thermoanaerobaculia bacterium]